MMKSYTKGFTLLELMIAAAILLIVISGLLACFVYCILMNESNNNLVIAVNDAQRVLEEVRGLAYTAIDTYEPSDFTKILNNEQIDFSYSPLGSGIKEVTIDVSWIERQRQRNFQISTRIAR